MIAVLLCAGYATRMYPLTRQYPKPLLPVAGRPVIDYLMDQLAASPAIEHVHLVTNDRFADRFQKWQRGWSATAAERGIGITVHNDRSTTVGDRLGAAGDLHFVGRRIGFPPETLVSAGDNIYRFDIGPLAEAFSSSRTHCIVALPESDPAMLQKSGVPVFGDGDRVHRLLEKPLEPPSKWFCPPLYFLRQSAWQALDKFLETADPARGDAPGHFIDYLCRKETVVAFKLDATRLDIGDLADYRRADRLLQWKTHLSVQ